jgi:hypothetical protein
MGSSSDFSDWSGPSKQGFPVLKQGPANRTLHQPGHAVDELAQRDDLALAALVLPGKPNPTNKTLHQTAASVFGTTSLSRGGW